jgi:hypothetical protein
MALLAQSRDAAADTTKDVCALFGVETSGYFLLQLARPQVMFSQIVVKKHPKISHKTQACDFMFNDPDK